MSMDLELKFLKAIQKSNASSKNKLKLSHILEDIVNRNIQEEGIQQKIINEAMDKALTIQLKMKYLLFDKEANEREKTHLQGIIDELLIQIRLLKEEQNS